MIYFILTYLLFIIAYEHWGRATVISEVIYYTFQYLWIAVLSLYSARKEHKAVFIILAVIFASLALNELLCLDLTQTEYKQAVNSAGPVFGLTILSILLFLVYEIIQWKRNKRLV
jgi:hypothetical protein